jgi:hypothetical protein
MTVEIAKLLQEDETISIEYISTPTQLMRRQGYENLKQIPWYQISKMRT